MKKIPIFIKVTIAAMIALLLSCVVLFNADLTLIMIISILLGSIILIIINTHIPEFIKIVLAVIITALLWWVILYKFYLTITMIISILLSGIILTVISKNTSRVFKITLSIIQILALCWIAVFMIDMNRMNNLKEPIFAKIINNSNNIYTYRGIGYEIKLNYNNGHFVEGEMHIFKKTVGAVISTFKNS